MVKIIKNVKIKKFYFLHLFIISQFQKPVSTILLWKTIIWKIVSTTPSSIRKRSTPSSILPLSGGGGKVGEVA